VARPTFVQRHFLRTSFVQIINIDEKIRNDKREYEFYWSQEKYGEYLQVFVEED
jgi:hypothetical protein